MIYTLTLNPSIDYTAVSDGWSRGEVNRTKNEACYPGGKGVNVSVVLGALGVTNVAMGFVGGFTGSELIRMLEQRNVVCDFVPVAGDTRINVKILHEGETQFNGAGPIVDEVAVERLYQKLECLKSGDYLVMAGSIPSCLGKDFYERIMERFYDRGVRFVVDATKDLLMNTLKYKPFLVKPNDIELGELFGVKISSVEEVVQYAKQLQAQGAQNVIVSMGGKGAVLVSENGEVKYADAPSGKVVNTVGAGDSVVAGFIAEYYTTGNYVRSFYRGLATGSATAFSKTLATKEESDRIFYCIYKD